MSALFNAGNKLIKMAKHTNTLTETAQMKKLRKKKLVRRTATMSKLTSLVTNMKLAGPYVKVTSVMMPGQFSVR